MFRYNKNGFTLIGVIISLFIISIGLTSIVVLVNFSINSSTTSKMRLIASGLAQEGIEIVRNVRRSNLDWDSWYNSVPTRNYLVQYNSAILLPFQETTLKINSNGYYQYGPGDDTPFYRRVYLNKVSANEVRVTVEVKWKTKNNWSYLTAEDHLWNWK